MRFAAIQLLSLVAIVLSACAQGTPDQHAQWERDAARPIVCTNELECEVMWGRALDFVRRFSSHRIISASKYAITTAKPEAGDTDVGYTITRFQNPDGTRQIGIKLECYNVFGCLPSPMKTLADFHNYVLR